MSAMSTWFCVQRAFYSEKCRLNKGEKGNNEMPNKRTSSQANNKICLFIFFFVISFLFLPLLLLLLLLFLYLAYYSFDLILPLLCFSFGNLFKIYIIKWVCIVFKCVICALLLPICVSLSVDRTNGRMGMWHSCGFQVDWVCYHNNKKRNQDSNSCSGETHIRRPLPPMLTSLPMLRSPSPSPSPSQPRTSTGSLSAFMETG